MSTATRHSGDRRLHARFEILGRVWGTLETVTGMTIYNISRGGALIGSPVWLAQGSVHRISVRRGEAQATIEARVRHARRTAESDDDYLVGVEFLAPTTALRALIDAIIEPEV